MGLRDKYAYAIQTAKDFHMQGSADERDGKLHFHGTVNTQEEANKIWDAIKTIPSWPDEIAADIKATGASAAAPQCKPDLHGEIGRHAQQDRQRHAGERERVHAHLRREPRSAGRSEHDSAGPGAQDSRGGTQVTTRAFLASDKRRTCPWAVRLMQPGRRPCITPQSGFEPTS